MRCPYCGKKNADSMRFCSGCGSTLEKNMEQMRQGKGTFGLVFCLLVITIALAAIIFYRDLSGLNDSNDGNESEQAAIVSSAYGDSEDFDIYENADYIDANAIEAYQTAIEMLGGNVFTMEIDVFSFLYTGDGDDWDDWDDWAEYDYDAYFTVNVNDHNLDSMTMSGYCTMYRGDDYDSESEYSFYYEDGITYYSYTSPTSQKVSETGQPASALLDFLLELTVADDDLIDSYVYDDYISLEVDGNALDLTELMYEILGDSYDYSCEEVIIYLQTDYAGRPLELSVWFNVECEISNVSVTASYYEEITFSNYEPAQVIRPSDLDSYVEASS